MTTTSDHLRLPLFPLVGCDGCVFRRDCGGLDPVQRELYGCFTYCKGTCAKNDWTCPVCRPEEFASRWSEVEPEVRGPLLPLSGDRLPRYIPMLRGPRLALRRTISLSTVALPTFDLLAMRRGGIYGPADVSGNHLRARLRLPANARVLLVSVATDKPLERYWRERQVSDTATSLARLNLVGMTWPNYSFFSDAPPMHRTWNRRRMLRVGAELSAAGIPVVPHLNAVCSTDWNHWVRVLRENPSITYVTKEFGTGLRNRERGEAAINALIDLQERVQRDLHPVVVSGHQYLHRIAREFSNFTLVDSMPFIRTMVRQRLVGPAEAPTWVENPTRHGAPIDSLLDHNLRAYSVHVAAVARGARQLSLNFSAASAW